MDAPDVLMFILLATVSFGLAFHGAVAGLQLGQLRLPLLMYFLPPAAASAANLTVSGIGAFSGAIGHGRAGRISVPIFLLMGVPSVLGSLVGAWLLARAEPTYARIVVGGFLVFNAANMLLSGPEDGTRGDRPLGRQFAVEAAIGLALGFLAAITGLMLGSLRLPRMIRQLGMDPKLAIGTNMAVGCVTAFVAAISLHWQDGTPLAGVVVGLAIPTVIGGWMGSVWAGTFEKADLSRLVGWTVGVAGLLMLGHGLLGVRRAIGS